MYIDVLPSGTMREFVTISNLDQRVQRIRPEVRRLLHNPALLRAAPHPGQIESALVCV